MLCPLELLVRVTVSNHILLVQSVLLFISSLDMFLELYLFGLGLIILRGSVFGRVVFSASLVIGPLSTNGLGVLSWSHT
jgi:hypothetical protein